MKTELLTVRTATFCSISIFGWIWYKNGNRKLFSPVRSKTFRMQIIFFFLIVVVFHAKKKTVKIQKHKKKYMWTSKSFWIHCPLFVHSSGENTGRTSYNRIFFSKFLRRTNYWIEWLERERSISISWSLLCRMWRSSIASVIVQTNNPGQVNCNSSHVDIMLRSFALIYLGIRTSFIV